MILILFFINAVIGQYACLAIRKLKKLIIQCALCVELKLKTVLFNTMYERDIIFLFLDHK